MGFSSTGLRATDSEAPQLMDEVTDSPLSHPDAELAGVDAEVDAEIRVAVAEGFVIDTIEKVNWLVRRVLAARQYKRRVDQWAEAEKHRAEREEDQLMFLFGGQLRTWVEQELKRTRTKAKSLNLPAGRVGLRMAGPTLVIDDAEACLAWAKSNCPAAVVMTEKVLKTPLHRHIEDTGELPHGARIEPQREVFYLK